jgi:hypothetical protein
MSHPSLSRLVWILTLDECSWRSRLRLMCRSSPSKRLAARRHLRGKTCSRPGGGNAPEHPSDEARAVRYTHAMTIELCEFSLLARQFEGEAERGDERWDSEGHYLCNMPVPGLTLEGDDLQPKGPRRTVRVVGSIDDK